jgi:ketosteroid isomerase-like protein
MLVLSMALSAALTQAVGTDDIEQLRTLIVQGARHCEAGRPDRVVEHYAPDIVLQYPGAPDQDLNTLRAGYRQLCGPGPGTVESTVPDFEEVLVMGDVAVIRVIWATHLRGMPEGAVRRLRDVQIWQRTNGSWRFRRGVHYPFG